jgi:hypothetical protein
MGNTEAKKTAEYIDKKYGHLPPPIAFAKYWQEQPESLHQQMLKAKPENKKKYRKIYENIQKQMQENIVDDKAIVKYVGKGPIDIHKERLKKLQEIFPTNNKMYGYGELGEGYRYPSSQGRPVKNVTLVDKRGRKRTFTVDVPSKQWAAAYYLNKMQADNSWVQFMRHQMPKLGQAYYQQELAKAATPKAKTLLTYKMHNPVRRRKHAELIEALKDEAELAGIDTMTKDQLLALYYGDDLEKALKRQQKARQRLVKKALAFQPPQ